MNELININYDSDRPTVLGRELHEKLRIKTVYPNWFNRMCEYGFEDGKDYMTVSKNVIRADGTKMPQMQAEHQLTVDMAKQICMIQRTDIGRQFREYFIAVEEQWNSPDAIMQRALQIANARVEKLRGENKQLQADNAALTVDKQIMQPKADYFDQIVDRNLLTNFRDTAKQLGIKPRTFTSWLLEHKYLFRDKHGKLNPYEAKNNGLFEIKEFVNEKTGFASTQTMVTPKGRETFRLLCEGL
ncbi:MAG: antA/AntB antirepressor family protein [Eubacteriales bacterium]|nr:antA/AntB antirepressor family protein [Eubacteriales bacterium]